MSDEEPKLIDGSIAIGHRLIEPSRGFRGMGWQVTDMDTHHIEAWNVSKEHSIKSAIEKTHGEGDYGAAVALIAEVMLDE